MNDTKPKFKKKSLVKGSFKIKDVKALREYARNMPDSIQHIACDLPFKNSLIKEFKDIKSLNWTEIESKDPSCFKEADVWHEITVMKPSAIIPDDKILILDQVVDPQNFGSVVRTAAFFGFRQILLAKDRQSLLSDASIRVARGGFSSVQLLLVANLSQAIVEIQKKGSWVIGGALGGTSLPESKFSSKDKIALLIGSEEKGIREKLLNACDELIRIPSCENGVESLNLSVATGILCAHYGGFTHKK